MDPDTKLPDGWDGIYVLISMGGTPLRAYRDKDKAEADALLLSEVKNPGVYKIVPVPLVP